MPELDRKALKEAPPMSSIPAAVERTQQFGAEVEAILKASLSDRKMAVVCIMNLFDRELSRLEEENAKLRAGLERIAAIPERVCEPFQDGLAAKIAASLITKGGA